MRRKRKEKEEKRCKPTWQRTFQKKNSNTKWHVCLFSFFIFSPLLFTTILLLTSSFPLIFAETHHLSCHFSCSYFLLWICLSFPSLLSTIDFLPCCCLKNKGSFLLASIILTNLILSSFFFSFFSNTFFFRQHRTLLSLPSTNPIQFDHNVQSESWSLLRVTIHLAVKQSNMTIVVRSP